MSSIDEKPPTPTSDEERANGSDIHQEGESPETAKDDEGRSSIKEEPIARPKSHRSLSLHRSRSGKAQQHIVQEVYPETDLDRNLVGWDGQDDPAHPSTKSSLYHNSRTIQKWKSLASWNVASTKGHAARNYPDPRKFTLLGFVSGITFLTPLCSSVIAPGISLMNVEFHNTSPILSTLTVSIFILGFAVGPLILSPLSEIYGRRPVLNYSNAFLTVWQLAGALAPNLGSLIAFRFLAGLGGSACLSIGGGVIADLFPIEQRGLANAVFVVGPLFGPVIGPIIGGFIAERAGWRWVYWVLLIACGVFSLGFFILGKETNAVVLIRAKTKKLRKESGNEDLTSAYDADKDPATLTSRAVLKRGVIRPFRMLFSSPIFPLLALYMSFVFSLVYLIFTTITGLFISVYHWDPELCGLAYLGVGLGFMIGMVVVAATSDPTVVRLTKANNGVYAPEMRLATCLFYAFFVPISFFWYGWSADKHTHWIVPILGLLPFGFGTMGIFAAIQTYFIDAAGQYAASAMAGLTAIRCLFAAFLPLAGPYMYSSLGLGWGNSLLGFIALGLIPVPALIYSFGGKLRAKYPIRID